MASILYFEDLRVGACWRSPSRLISAEDVRQFAQLTGDHTPLHSPSLDQRDGSRERSNVFVEEQSGDFEVPFTTERTAFRSPFGRPVVHGLLGLGILAGLSSEHPRVSTLALVKLGEWQFHHPIYFGETVYAETEVIEVTAYGRRAGKVLWQRRLHAKDGRVLQSGTLQTIVARREPLKSIRAPRLESSIMTPSQVTSN